MTERPGSNRGWMWVLAIAGAALVAVLAYNAGVSAGVAQQGTAEPARLWHGHHWYFPFGPFLLIFLIFWTMGMFRRAIWGWGPRPWIRHGYHPGWDGPWDLEEWHRRAHANDLGTTKEATNPPSSSNP